MTKSTLLLKFKDADGAKAFSAAYESARTNEDLPALAATAGATSPVKTAAAAPAVALATAPVVASPASAKGMTHITMIIMAVTVLFDACMCGSGDVIAWDVGGMLLTGFIGYLLGSTCAFVCQEVTASVHGCVHICMCLRVRFEVP